MDILGRDRLEELAGGSKSYHQIPASGGGTLGQQPKNTGLNAAQVHISNHGQYRVHVVYATNLTFKFILAPTTVSSNREHHAPLSLLIYLYLIFRSYAPILQDAVNIFVKFIVNL